MPNSYVSNYVHVVFGTKSRTRAIKDDLQPRLWSYMVGIARKHGFHAIAIGGMPDHVHALINLGATLSISEAVKVLKANSSRWLGKKFEWQEGYFACSVSRSQISVVSRYIANQREHHKKRDFAAEFESLLKKHGFVHYR